MSGTKKDDEDAEGCWGCSCSDMREVARFVRTAVRQVRARVTHASTHYYLLSLFYEANIDDQLWPFNIAFV